MNDDFSFAVRTKIVSLSTKLKCLKNEQVYSSNNISEYFIEKLRYNLSLLMAEIIRNLEFVNKSREMFVSIIEEYNQENNARLAFDNFETMCWIRIIHNEIEIPAVIEHFMWALNQNYDEEITEIPEDRKDMSLCLLRYYKCIHNRRARISAEKLNLIVKKLNLANDAIAFLVEKHILEADEGNKIYLWGIMEHYPEILNNEIAASLWLLEKNESNLRGSFFRYYSLIRKSHIKLNDLSKYLTPNDYLALFLQAVEYLKNEVDLQNSEQEAAKIWFDHDGFSHHNIWKDIPILNFSATDTYELLKIIDNNSEFWRLDDVLYMQKTRVFCYSLLSFIIKYELPDNNYHFTLKILKDISRPSLVFEVLFIIERDFPEIIPWFLGDLNLVPVAMDIIDEFELNPNYYTNDSRFDNKLGKELSIKNTIWLEAINTILLNITDIWRSSVADKRQIGKMLALIYLNLSRKIFSLYSTVNPNGISQLEKLSERYSESLKLLQNLKTNPGNFYNASPNSQSLFPFVFQDCMAYIIDCIEKLPILDKNSLNFYFEYYDISIDFIRVVDNLYTTEIISSEIREKNENHENKVIEVLFKNICSYLKFDINDGVPSEKYWFELYIENLNYIDWGYFFVLLYKYDLFAKLDTEFSSSIKVDSTSNKYTDRNRNQRGKVRLIFRIIYLGYLSLKSIRTDIYASGIQIADVCNSLENFITKYTGFYSVDNYGEERFDVFDDFPFVIIDKKGESLLELFLNCLNYMKTTVQTELIKEIFSNSIKLERMLAAINIIMNITIKSIISEFIKNIDIEKFVDSCFMITNIEEAVFQALYSEQYWQIAESLISRIKGHYNERKFKRDREHYLIFQADLLLALRKKDLAAIQAVEFPTKTYLPREYKTSELKQFFTALHKIDNEKNYTQAINILKGLLSYDSQNIDYAITLFRASIFEYLSLPDISIDSVNTSYNNWVNFTNSLGGKKEDILARNREVISFCSVPYYILNNKIIEFDNAMAHLTNEHKFNEPIISLVYNFYRERNLDRIAYDYMNDAKNYYIRANKEIPNLVDKVLSDPSDQRLIDLRNSFKTIISTHYKSVPKIVPDNINNRNEINNFILDELFQALNQMLTKKQTIKHLEKEDDFTDILQSILKLRFPFYGWSMHDHPHYGISEKGLGSGEPDIVIESSAKSITIIESLILTGKNKKVTHTHIGKCFNYSNSLERYYIVIYYRGKENKFDNTWKAYVNDFNSCLFPEGKELTGEFVMLNNIFDNVNSFKIAKTCHTSFEMFHVMVNFSTEK